MMSPVLADIKVADEVWIAAALLHRERPGVADFSVEEIVDRARREGLHEPLRPGVYVHVNSHCVANRTPKRGRYRMLFESAEGRRRLFHSGDPFHPDREGSKITPNREELPERYHPLLEWYRDWNRKRAQESTRNDPLLSLRGSGKDLWADEHADEYVERLRKDWE